MTASISVRLVICPSAMMTRMWYAFSSRTNSMAAQIWVCELKCLHVWYGPLLLHRCCFQLSLLQLYVRGFRRGYPARGF